MSKAKRSDVKNAKKEKKSTKKKKTTSKLIVISLGGSVIVPSSVDEKFLEGFQRVLEKRLKKKGNGDLRFIIVTGGGSTARNYIAAVRERGLTRHYQDELGIAATRINALLLATFFKKYHLHVPQSKQELAQLLTKHRIVFTGGFLEDIGSTSDGTAAELAAQYGAELFINITNVKGLYTKNPKKFRDATFIPKISYADFYERFIKRMTEESGQHFVLDRRATLITMQHQIPVAIVSGLDNLEKCLNKRKFVGTLIH